MDAQVGGYERVVLDEVLQQMPSAVFIADPQGKVRTVNQRWSELSGLAGTDALGDGWMAAVHPEDLTELVGSWWSAMQLGEGPFDRCFRFLRPDGSEMPVHAVSRPVADGVGTTVAWVGSVEATAAATDQVPDTSPGARELEVAGAPILLSTNGRFELAFECSPIGMALTTLEGRYLRVNPAMCTLLGRSAASVCELSVLETTHPDDLRRTVDAAVELLDGVEPSFSIEKRFIASDGRAVWTRSTTTVLRDDDGVPLHFLTQVEDIEERHQLMEQLRWSALRDPLTRLANRTGLEEYLSELPPDATIGVLALDLDRFKRVNDTAGHAAGDEVLKVVAQRILASIRKVDHAARTGGDEFVVVCSDPRAEHEVASIADRLLERISEPISIGDVSLCVGVSAGVSVGPASTATALRLSADEASYRAKRRGGAVVSLSVPR